MDVLGEFFRVLQEAGETPPPEAAGERALRECRAAVAEYEAAQEARWQRHAAERKQAQVAYEAANQRRAAEHDLPPVQIAATAGWWGEPRPVPIW
jgi:hypothetical protein